MHLKSQDDGTELASQPPKVKSKKDLKAAAKSGEEVTVEL